MKDLRTWAMSIPGQKERERDRDRDRAGRVPRFVSSLG